MPLEDRDIFANICSLFSSQPIEEIMRQYEKAKMLNYNIERRFNAIEAPMQEGPDIRVSIIESADNVPETLEVAPVSQEAAEPVKIRRKAPAKASAPEIKKPTRADLIINPEEAITDETIQCCICGVAKKLLTNAHLVKHGLTPAEYRELCGYPPKMPLMSNQRRAKSMALVSMARQARIAKRNEQEYM